MNARQFVVRGWHIALGCAIALAAATPAGATTGAADDGVPPNRAVIHFVDYGGIRNWRADNDQSLLIEAENGNWYKATFFGPCIGLRFANTIGFVSDASGSVDKFSSIVVREPAHMAMECHFREFSQLPGPPPPAERG
jgi:hypothetical protein